MLEHLEVARAKFNEFMESEMISMIRALAALRKENEVLRSAVDKANSFSAETTYDVKYRGEVQVVFHADRLTTGKWNVVSSSVGGTRSSEALHKLAAIEMIDAAIANMDHDLVKDHLS